MPATARLDGKTVWAVELDDNLWNALKGRADDRLILPCCGSPAAMVENLHNEYCPRFFRHASKRKSACRRKELSPQYERLIPVIKQSAEQLGWIVHPDMKEDEVFIDLLLTRMNSPIRVIVQVDLSFPKDRPRAKVSREWQRLAVRNDVVLAIVRGWRSTPPVGVTTCIQPHRDDAKMAVNIEQLLSQIENTYKISHTLQLTSASVPTAPNLVLPRFCAWKPKALSTPAIVRIAPGKIHVSLEHLDDAEISRWDEHLRSIRPLFVRRRIDLQIARPPYIWHSRRPLTPPSGQKNPTSKNVRASSFDDEFKAYAVRRAIVLIEDQLDLFDFDEPQDWLEGLSFNEYADKRNDLLQRVRLWFGISD